MPSSCHHLSVRRKIQNVKRLYRECNAYSLQITVVLGQVVFLLFSLRFEGSSFWLFLLRKTCEIIRHFLQLYENS